MKIRNGKQKGAKLFDILFAFLKSPEKTRGENKNATPYRMPKKNL